jgi:hypothetical protein
MIMREGRSWLVLLAAVLLTQGRARAETEDLYRRGAFPPLDRPGDEAPARDDPPFLIPLDRRADLADLNRPYSTPLPDWLTGTQPERAPRKASTSSQGLLGTVTTSVVVNETREQAPWEEPLWKRTWNTSESWRCTLAGPVTVFGKVGANSEEAGQSDLKVAGRTGLECKLPVLSFAEFLVRAGPGVSYTDPLRSDRAREKSDWQVEVQVRCPLVYGIGLEYQGVALPALTPQGQDQINHDVRLAFPVGSAGKFQLGAKHSWTGTADQRPWTDTMQLYMGLELAR